MLVVLTIVAVIALWWGSTGAIFWLGRRDVGTYPATLVGMTFLAALSVLAMIISSGERTVWGAFLAFIAGLSLWGWHEASFLLGFVTGPRRVAQTAGARGLQRFREAFAAVRTHELALFATVLLLAAMSFAWENQIAVCTFTLLWVLRISAKLALFTGVPHFSDALMPKHLAHIGSYFRVRPGNRLVQGTIALGFLGLALLLEPLLQGGARLAPVDVVGRVLLATLLGLAVLEHLFLLIPVKDSALWDWSGSTKSDPTLRRRAVPTVGRGNRPHENQTLDSDMPKGLSSLPVDGLLQTSHARG